MLTEDNIDPNLDLVEEIQRLKMQMNAVILAHYYQDPEIQDIADSIGDSLDLSKKAADSNADVIIFCGVTFMAEVAKILNPTKLVLIPDGAAGCSLEEACETEKFRAFRNAHPDHIAITYINCSAEIKALSDIIVTSSNAQYIVNNLPKEQKIIFAPDKYLGDYINRQTGREMLLWDGTCIVHEQFSEKQLIQLRNQHPEAKIIAHPECPKVLLDYAQHIGSTRSLIDYVVEHDGGEFIVLTELGIIHQMKKSAPNSIFYDVPTSANGCTSCNACPYMKLNTLEKLYLSMVNQSPSIELDAEISAAAKKSLTKMLELSP